MPVAPTDPKVRFERYRGKPNPVTGCQCWMGAKTRRGYGVFNMGGYTLQAHRAALIFKTGFEHVGLDVLHSCDNPSCVNVDHLSWGTHNQNMRQMSERNRVVVKPSYGEKSHLHKLKEPQVREIFQMREQGVAIGLLATRFGVSKTTVSRICNGYVWRHLGLLSHYPPVRRCRRKPM